MSISLMGKYFNRMYETVECVLPGKLGSVEFVRGDLFAVCGTNNGINVMVEVNDDPEVMLCHCFGNSLIPVEFRGVDYSPNSEPLPEFAYI